MVRELDYMTFGVRQKELGYVKQVKKGYGFSLPVPKRLQKEDEARLSLEVCYDRVKDNSCNLHSRKFQLAIRKKILARMLSTGRGCIERLWGHLQNIAGNGSKRADLASTLALTGAGGWSR